MEAERLNLRGVLNAVEAPFPALRRPLPLGEAVRCAAELWGDDSAAESNPVARMAEAARAGSQDLIEKTAALGSSLAKWGQAFFAGVGAGPRSVWEGMPQTERSDRDARGGGASRSRTCYLGLWDGGKEPGEYRHAADHPERCGPGGALGASIRSRGGLAVPRLRLPVAADFGPEACCLSSRRESKVPGAACALEAAACEDGGGGQGAVVPLQPPGAAAG